MKKITILESSAGLNNKIDPVKIKHNPKNIDLAKAVNVNIGDSGRISCRRGFTKVKAGSFHSGFPLVNGDYCLAVTGTSLVVIGRGDYEVKTTIASVTYGAIVRYVLSNDGESPVVYWCNGYEKGMVKGEVSYPWTGLGYVGPTTSKTFQDPPIGHLLEIYNGKMYVAQTSGKYHTLWYSEDFAYSWFGLARSFMPFPNRLRMVKGVKNGLFISTDKEIFFIGGGRAVPDDYLQVADYPAIEGSESVTPGTGTFYFESEEGGESLSLKGMAVLFATTKGLCVGGENGFFANLTKRKLVLPSVSRGASLIMDDKFICTFES